MDKTTVDDNGAVDSKVVPFRRPGMNAAASAQLQTHVTIGVTMDGNFCMSTSNDCDAPKLLWLLELAKTELMSMAIEAGVPDEAS